MVRDADGLTDILHALKALGVRLVLDDFGTGYSSLSYLTRLPLDVLKVDRSFVDGLGNEPRDTAITETIIAMSRALSLDVVGGGRRDLRAGQRAEPARLHARPGLSLLSRGAGARDHRRARARPGLAAGGRALGSREPVATDTPRSPARSGETFASLHSYAPFGIEVRSVAVSLGGITWSA